MPDTDPVTGRGAMPGWAARHLAEAGETSVPITPTTPTTPTTPVTPPVPGRHRYGRRRHPEPSRLRGWALATAAVAAAVGTVPLAVASLARQDEPLPRVETFPVVSPIDIGRGDPGTSRPGAGLGAPGPDAAATLPPLTLAGGEADVVSPRVAPTAAGRPWRAEPRQTENARIPRARPPRAPQQPQKPQQPQRPPSTSVTPSTDPAPGDGEEPRENPGGGPTTSPRESTPTTTTPTTADDETPSRRPGLLGSTVHGVTGLLR